MDDCNEAEDRLTAAASEVQIPLWTIVTAYAEDQGCPIPGSDSSMDDCNRMRPRCLLRGAGFRFLYGRL